MKTKKGPESKQKLFFGDKKNGKVKKLKNRISKDEEEDNDPFPGKATVSTERQQKYQRIENVNPRGIRSVTDRKKYLNEAAKHKEAVLLAARSELILNEEHGYLDVDSEDESYKISQHDIAKEVDITSATKFFDLSLPQFGPYYINFFRNGRNLLLGGSKGHIAAVDWVTKQLLCEINVMESIHDITWLHMPTMFAVAQKKWVHVYDNVGTELHCVKSLYRIKKMEFLPYHFLLATASDTGFLSWLDVSIGKIVTQFHAKSGCLDVMCQNPANATIVTGHPNGVVNTWSPNVKEPLIKMMCHPKPIRAVAIDKTGIHLATASVDRVLKIWDLRNYKCLKSYKLGGMAGSLSYSETGLLAVANGNTIEVYENITSADVKKPYLRHTLKSFARDIQFCPYEDVLGMGHLQGYTSIIVPGSGEANFDAMESNPYMSTAQRREMEVRALLEKIQPEMITVNPSLLNQVDVETLDEKIEAIEEKKPNPNRSTVPSIKEEVKIVKKNVSGKEALLQRKEQKEKRKKELRRKSLKKSVKTVKNVTPGALGRFMN